MIDLKLNGQYRKIIYVCARVRAWVFIYKYFIYKCVKKSCYCILICHIVYRTEYHNDFSHFIRHLSIYVYLPTIWQRKNITRIEQKRVGCVSTYINSDFHANLLKCRRKRRKKNKKKWKEKKSFQLDIAGRWQRVYNILASSTRRIGKKGYSFLRVFLHI